MKHDPETDPLSQATLLRSIPKPGPPPAPEGFFELFPQRVQQAIAAQRREAWWRRLLPAALAPRATWALGASLAAALIWLALPDAHQPAKAPAHAPVEWAEEQALSDPYLLAELSASAASAPSVQHDLTPDEMATYLMACNAQHLLTEFQ